PKPNGAALCGEISRATFSERLRFGFCAGGTVRLDHDFYGNSITTTAWGRLDREGGCIARNFGAARPFFLTWPFATRINHEPTRDLARGTVGGAVHSLYATHFSRWQGTRLCGDG